MFTATMELTLSADYLRILRSMVRSTTLGAGLVRCARVVLALHEGQAYSAIVAAHGVTDKYIAKWKQRVREGGILALGDAPRSGRPDRLDPSVEAKILALTQDASPAPLTHWTTRRMATTVGVSHMTVARVWQRAGFKPHHLE
jgi:transposase